MNSATPPKESDYKTAWLKSFLERISSLNQSENSQYKFPNFNTKGIQTITNMLSIGTPLYDAIQTISNYFQFSNDIVSRCCLIQHKNDLNDELILAFLCCCISTIRNTSAESEQINLSNSIIIFPPFCNILRMHLSNDTLCVFSLIAKHMEKTNIACPSTEDISNICNILRKKCQEPSDHNICFEILCSLLNNCFNSGARRSITSLTAFLAYFVQNTLQSGINYNILLDIISQNMSPNDGDIGSLFATIFDVYKADSTKIDVEGLKSIVGKLAVSVVSLFFTEESSLFFDSNFTENINDFKNLLQKIEETQTFYRTFKNLSPSINEENAKLPTSSSEIIEEKYLNEISLEALGVLRPLISATSKDMKKVFIENFCGSYFEYYQKSNIDQNLSFIAFSLLLVSSILETKTEDNQFIFDLLKQIAEKTFLFSDKFSAFFPITDKSFADKLFEMRSFFINVIINYFPSFFSQFLKIFSDNFYQISEILSFCVQQMNNSICNQIVNKEFADIIGISLYNAAVINLSDLKTDKTQSIWSLLYDYCITILPLCPSPFISSSKFMFALLLHLLSANCSAGIITILHNNLYQGEDIQYSLPELMEIKDLPFECLSILFEQINDNLASRPSYINTYKGICPCVYSHYVNNPDSFGSLSLLITFIIGDLYSPSLEEKYVLCQRIRDNSKDDNDISINVPSHCLLLSRKNVSQQGLILIEEPSFIVPILLIGESLKKSLEFYVKLGEYSTTNCTQFHIGRLDIFLCELIKSFGKEKVEFDGHTFPIDLLDEDYNVLIFPLLTKILSFSCNFESLNALTSIAKQKNVKFSEEILNILSMALCERGRLPHVTHIFAKESKALTFEITSDFSGGFSFSAWVYFDKAYSEIQASQCTLFSLTFTEGYGDGISVFLSGTSLHCILFSRFGTSTSSIVLCPNFPSCTWTFITLSIRPRGDDNAQIAFSINAEKSLAFLVRDAISKGPSIVRVGGMRKLNTKKSKISTNTLCRIGPFRLCPYTKAIKQEMVEMYSRPESITGDLLNLSNLPPIEELDSILTAVKERKFMTDCMLPLFSYCPERGGDFCVRLLDILKFCDFKHTQDLIRFFSHYMYLTAKSLPFRAFSTACDIYEITRDVNFLCRIVCRIDLWLETSTSVCLRSLQHVGETLTSSFGNYIFAYYGFRTLLGLFRKNLATKEENVFGCCCKILQQCCKSRGFVDADGISLAGHISIAANEGQSKLVSFFCSTLIAISDFIGDKLLFRIVSIISKYISNYPNAEDIYKVCETLAIICDGRIKERTDLSENDDDHEIDSEDCLFLILSTLSVENNEIAQKLSDLFYLGCSKCPLLLHFALKICSQFGIKKDFMNFIKLDEGNELFNFANKTSRVTFWPIWICKYASIFHDDGGFVAFCLFINKPLQFYSDMIIGLFSIFGSAGHKALYVFVQHCTKHLTSSHDKQIISSIVARSSSVFCLSREPHSQQILSLYKNSPFYDDSQNVENTQVKNQNEKDILSIITKSQCLRAPSPPFSTLVATMNHNFQSVSSQITEFCRFATNLHSSGGLSASRSLCGTASSVFSLAINDFNAHCIPRLLILSKRLEIIGNESMQDGNGVVKATHDIEKCKEFENNETVLCNNTLHEFGLI